MPTPQTQIFVTGATGYIGGTVLTRILNHPQAKYFSIIALVRSPQKAARLQEYGVTPVVGTLDDSKLLEEQASEADVILSMADLGHLSATRSLLKGLKSRFEATRRQAVFIHTSGTGVFSDNAAGMFQSDTIWSDADPTQISGRHLDVDRLLVAADEEGYARTYIIAPSTIYGIAKGPLFEAGISNPHSIQIPLFIRAGLDRKQGGMIGQGKNIWSNVNIEDLGDLYIIVLDAALNDASTGHGLNGYYIGENGAHSLYELKKVIAAELVDLTIGKSSDPTTFTDEEVLKYFGSTAPHGSNARTTAIRSRSLGWKPKKTTQDMLTSIRAEIEALLPKGK